MVASCTCPNQAGNRNCNPGACPLLGFEPETLRSSGQRSNHLTTSVRAWLKFSSDEDITVSHCFNLHFPISNEGEYLSMFIVICISFVVKLLFKYFSYFFELSFFLFIVLYIFRMSPLSYVFWVLLLVACLFILLMTF